MARYINATKLTEHIEAEWRKYGDEYDAYQILADIEDFPTTDVRENDWIPISKRLPDKPGWYFVTCVNQFGSEICQVAYYGNDGWTDNKGFGIQLIAWIPMPEPYRGDE